MAQSVPSSIASGLRSAVRSRLGSARPFRLRLPAILVAAGLLCSAGAIPTHAQSASTDPGGPADVCSRGKIAYYQRVSALKALADRETPTPNQAAWDARWYGLDLVLDPPNARLQGKVTVYGTVVSDSSISGVELNLSDSLTVTRVLSESAAGDTVTVQFTHSGGILRIALERPYSQGETFRVAVRYGGHPEPTAISFTRVEGRPHVWTLSEPFGARTWWPCKDYPEDKADSSRVRVTSPDSMIAASNGRLVSRTVQDGTETAVWSERHPIATYLVSLAVYPYDLSEDTYQPLSGPPMPLRFYTFPANTASWSPVQARVKDMIHAYAGDFGEYPFVDEKYGHADFVWPGGMENQTITSMGPGTINEGVTSHELTHQWWGDMVTCRNFHHIWLNEGFATYGEALWRESTGGFQAYQNVLLAYQYFGPGTIYVPDVSDWNRIFNADLSYHKAGWVLHMLRHIVGDDPFFQILRSYGERFRYSTATTEDFEAVAEEVSGKDLHAFFQEWIYGEGTPVYSYDWQVEQAQGGGWDLTVRLRQVQDGQIFTMPVDVRISTPSGDESFTVDNSTADTTYTRHVADRPSAIAIDPDQWILRRVYEPVIQAAFDRPLLVVNSLPWTTSSTQAEIRAMYEERSVWGGYAFDFWDTQSTPQAGYPSTLPPPLGHGAVPASVLGHYRAVVWLGEIDTGRWTASPMYSYLEAGGDLIVLAAGLGFVQGSFASYLGVVPAGTVDVGVANADAPGLVPLHARGAQNSVPQFSLRSGSNGRVLFSAGADTTLGIGFFRRPAEGGTQNPAGGAFAFIGGRPYRWNPADLRADMLSLLGPMLPNPGPQDTRVVLESPDQNPARGPAFIRFFLPAGGTARLVLWDAAGRKVRTLRNGPSQAGWNAEPWDGTDENGRRTPSGVYFYRLDAAGASRTQRLVRLAG